MTDRHEQPTNEMEAPTLEMEATTPGMDPFYRSCVEEMRERRGIEPQAEVAAPEGSGFWHNVQGLAITGLLALTAPIWMLWVIFDD